MKVGYFVCPQHGDVFKDEIGPATNEIYAKNLVPLVQGVEQPEPLSEVRCPLCDQLFVVELRET